MNAPRENNSGTAGDFSLTFQADKTAVEKATPAEKKLIGALPLEKMKDAVLGDSYSLSVVITDSAFMRKLNRERRGKDRSTDILSFALAPDEGELFLNLAECRRKAPDFERTFENYLPFVFIHGLLHLKGFDHGSTMESKEVRIRRLFGV